MNRLFAGLRCTTKYCYRCLWPFPDAEIRLARAPGLRWCKHRDWFAGIKWRSQWQRIYVSVAQLLARRPQLIEKGASPQRIRGSNALRWHRQQPKLAMWRIVAQRLDLCRP